MALAAGSAEFFGGIALLLGLLTRPAAFILAITMLVAIITVHLSNGLFMSNNGYEFGLALMTIAVALVFNGGGKLSLDRTLSETFSQGLPSETPSRTSQAQQAGNSSLLPDSQAQKETPPWAYL